MSSYPLRQAMWSKLSPNLLDVCSVVLPDDPLWAIFKPGRSLFRTSIAVGRYAAISSGVCSWNLFSMDRTGRMVGGDVPSGVRSRMVVIRSCWGLISGASARVLVSEPSFEDEAVWAA